MSEFFNSINDVISQHLPEVIAIVTSGTFVLLMVRFLLNLILIKVRAKTMKNANSEIAGKYEALEKKVESVVANLEKVFLEYMERYSTMTKEQFSSLMEQYQKTKREYLKAVISAENQTKELIEKAREIQKEIREKPQEEVVEEPIEEPIEEIESISEEPQVEQEVEPQVINSAEEPEEDGYIKVKKIYGE